MCGIVAYIGSRQALPLLIEGLKRLEYRGYDSAGVAVIDNGKLRTLRAVGRVADLEQRLERQGQMRGTIGLAHTRWATHGGVTEANAHPHRDDRAGIALVHNGIIENYATLRTWLEEKGHRFTSETDTEVLAMLIGELYDLASGVDLEAAVQAALREVTGAYAIAVVCEHEPGVLVAARKGSPLMVGVGAGEYIVASDPAAIVAHTTQAFPLDDYNVVKLTREGLRTSTVDNAEVTPRMMQLELDLEQIELGSFEHFMQKEIFEQPRAIRNCCRGRIDEREGKVVLGGLSAYAKELVKARRFIFVAQGTALHAAMIGEYLFEDLAKVPAEVEYGSEFRYRNPIIEDSSVVVAVSQSGETADTLAALTEAKERGALALGVINVVGSTIARETDAGVYLRVGPEVGVASTKAFTGQVTALAMIALFLARRKFTSQEECAAMLSELSAIPDKMERVLGQDDHIRRVTRKYVDRENWLFLGRGYNYPTALEGALKLKEISYIHAEGMPAAEMKHGPIALINDGMPAVFIANRGRQYDKVLSNIAEVRSRGGHVIAVATEGDTEIAQLAEDVLYVPECAEPLSPLLTVVPLQLMAYHAAVLRGHDVDKPRNLAKSVTVE
ncbi:MAG: glutamine--fructose-6-phosphate transaminase (isomerizing) [Leptolyngbya sp. PLA2]|nr:glutamine--fructose-6-phosphate transaminase (isomerizing) [Leptolyngbya sp. PL-A2]MCQ3940103.1 glutamine--fructose-6-phosphate transaminase (isomerizing) [cyanobacterium CYA1]MCZ7632776.1 glutamine--fructose-6-phosphate transaminase (isomerizing) [Phycisphaerales bacterium]MDL1904160.1 glutamine--fructose-6-phosphate transaminase (isomerizing) [Synechococcales cyanobacterium CNB]GIK19151.1 MAG: glutamine--fructose-6-phosphate aminotransferase [isomerizing] [Planctomycetota bacterium]